MELTWSKIWSSLVAAFVMRWAAIPPTVGPLVVLMLADLALGTILALHRGDWNVRKFGNGVLRKLGAFFMLGATAAVTEHALQVSFDPIDYFVKAMTVYEFLSCADSYRKFGGPGSPWLNRFVVMVQATFEKRALTQEGISTSLQANKLAGEQTRRDQA